MNMIANAFGFLLKTIYNAVSAMGAEPANISYFAISVLVITVLYKVITLPMTISTVKMQKINAKMAPEVAEIRKKFKNDPQGMQKKIAELNAKYNYNPLKSCLPMIFQIVIMFAFLRIMKEPTLYIFGESVHEGFRDNFFWVNSLAQPDKTLWGLALLNGVTQFFLFELMQPQTKAGKEADPSAGMMGGMKYIMPVVIYYSTLMFSAGLALYWGFGNILDIIIRLILNNIMYKEELEEEYGNENN